MNPLLQGTRVPVIAAPMFLVSTPTVVNACREAGIVGTFPALNARTTEELKSWCEQITAFGGGRELPAWGVNLIVHPSNPRLLEDLAVLEQFKAPLIITSLGAVPDLVQKVHSWGGQVFHDVTNTRHARKAAGAGVDGIIAVGAGAGGHAGSWSPLALATEIRSFFKGTLVLAGCINTGAEVLAAQALGAEFAYMGTRFIATEEAQAVPAYKQMIVDASAADIVYTPAISGVPASFLAPSLQSNGFDVEALRKNGAEGGKLKSLHEEAKAWKTVWSAGQGVAGIHDVPSIRQLVDRLVTERSEALARLGG